MGVQHCGPAGHNHKVDGNLDCTLEADSTEALLWSNDTVLTFVLVFCFIVSFV